MSRFRIGIDIGGTFTDFVVLDPQGGRLRTEKTLTTPHDLWEGIWDGLQRLEVDLSDAEVAHGTTVGLNTFLERRGAPTGLVTTAGFRDVYEIGRGARPDMYNLFFRKPVPLIPRQHRLEVRERIDAGGLVVQELDDSDVLAAIGHFRDHGVADIAVCFLHAYRNPVHEARVAALFADVYPEAAVSTSHSLVREWREYERTSTVAINAYIRRRTGAYMDRAMTALRAAGCDSELFVNQSAGGVVSVRTAAAKPVMTLMSGPAGGVAASARIGVAIDRPNVIAFDMGGTSTDVSVILNGQPRLTAESEIERHPISIPTIDIHSIGAGGGSIAWLDEVGALNVGPRSAGADPGPVCYGRGAIEPTVTDANLVLGRLAPREFVPGGLELDREGAAGAIASAVGDPLELSTVKAAAGIIAIVNLKMSMAVRAVTVQRGLDPRDFVLMAFGGAGGAHAAWIAAELGIPEVIVPAASGQFSALGVGLTDVRHDFVRTEVIGADALTAPLLSERFGAIEVEATAALTEEQVPVERIELTRSVDARYRGQEYTIAVPVAGGGLGDDAVQRLQADFHRLHERTYGHASPGEGVEVVNLRVSAVGRLPEVQLPGVPDGGKDPDPAAHVTVGTAIFDAHEGPLQTPIFRRDALRAGNEISGPAIVADRGATTVVPPGARCVVGRHGELAIDVTRMGVGI